MIVPESSIGTTGTKTRFYLSKLPLYTLYIFNWIPYNIRGINVLKFVLLLIITILINEVGLISNICFVYWFLSNETFSKAPPILAYTYISLQFYCQINGYLFLYKSWRKEKTDKILEMLDQSRTPYMWVVKYQIYMISMITFVFGSVLISYFVNANVYQDDAYHTQIYHFTADKDLVKHFSNLQQIVSLYANIIFYMFPVFIAYICICLNAMSNILHKKLKEIITSDELSIDNNFKNFINKFDQTMEMVSMADECYSVNIVCYIIMAVNNIIIWLYLQLVFDTCNLDRMAVVKAMCDAIGLLILLVATSSVQPKVRFSSLLKDIDRREG